MGALGGFDTFIPTSSCVVVGYGCGVEVQRQNMIAVSVRNISLMIAESQINPSLLSANHTARIRSPRRAEQRKRTSRRPVSIGSVANARALHFEHSRIVGYCIPDP